MPERRTTGDVRCQRDLDKVRIPSISTMQDDPVYQRSHRTPAAVRQKHRVNGTDFGVTPAVQVIALGKELNVPWQ